MSSATSVDVPAQGVASAAPGQLVASYPTYEQAQSTVDHLSDSGFPVEQSTIIGRDLRLVEQVVGRLTKTRSTVMGAASGAWFGLFVGTLVTLFVIEPEWLIATLTAVVIGAVWGAVFGFVPQWGTHGRRDFASASAVVAARTTSPSPTRTPSVRYSCILPWVDLLQPSSLHLGGVAEMSRTDGMSEETSQRRSPRGSATRAL